MTRQAVPIFVVGCYRSGTTMVERMLLSHPRIAGPGFETQAFSRLAFGRRPDHPREHEQYAHASTNGSVGSAFENFERAVRADMERTGATHWVEKTPDHVFHVDTMMRRYPEARFVQVLRDGRDVVTSLLEFPSIVPHARTRFNRLVAGCALWEWIVLEGFRAHREVDANGRMKTVRYEELVGDPESGLRSLLAYLDLPATVDDVASVERRMRTVEGNSSYEPGVTGVYGSGVGRWTDPGKLSEEERALIEWLIGPTLVLAGYVLGPPRPVPGAVRARSSAGKLFWLGVLLARFRANVGYWPPPHLSEVRRRAVRPVLTLGGSGGFS